jgi:hypothetical protein
MFDGADGRHCGYPRYQLKIAIAVASVAEHETFNILKSKGLPERAHAELAKQVTLLAAYWHCEQRQPKKDQETRHPLIKAPGSIHALEMDKNGPMAMVPIKAKVRLQRQRLLKNPEPAHHCLLGRVAVQQNFFAFLVFQRCRRIDVFCSYKTYSADSHPLSMDAAPSGRTTPGRTTSIRHPH